MDNNPALRVLPEDKCVIVQVQDAKGNWRNKIDNGPVYDLKEAKKEVRKRQFFYVTLKAIDDQNDAPTGDELREFIEAMTHQSHYHDSERCETSKGITEPPWLLDADSYTMKWNSDYRKEFNDAPAYYLKFGFNDKNPKFMIVSMHES